MEEWGGVVVDISEISITTIYYQNIRSLIKSYERINKQINDKKALHIQKIKQKLPMKGPSKDSEIVSI